MNSVFCAFLHIKTMTLTFILRSVDQVKIQGQNDEMLQTACQQFLGKRESEIRNIAQETLEGHQRAIMGCMTVEVGHWVILVIIRQLCVECQP